MVKLFFKAYKKIYIYIYINVNKISLKNKERLSKKAHERYQSLSGEGEEKGKSVNTLVSDIEIFLQKKKKRSVNMVVNDTKIF